MCSGHQVEMSFDPTELPFPSFLSLGRAGWGRSFASKLSWEACACVHIHGPVPPGQEVRCPIAGSFVLGAWRKGQRLAGLWGLPSGFDAYGLCLFQRWLLPSLSFCLSRGRASLCWRDTTWCMPTLFLHSPWVAGSSS